MHTEATIDCSSQSSFAAGTLIMSAITGTHPLPGYPASHRDSNDITIYTEGEFPSPSASFPYPKSFHSIMLDLIQCEPTRRLGLGEALNQLKVCCRRKSVVSRSELRKPIREEQCAEVSTVQRAEKFPGTKFRSFPCMSFRG